MPPQLDLRCPVRRVPSEVAIQLVRERERVANVEAAKRLEALGAQDVLHVDTRGASHGRIERIPSLLAHQAPPVEAGPPAPCVALHAKRGAGAAVDREPRAEQLS